LDGVSWRRTFFVKQERGGRNGKLYVAVTAMDTLVVFGAWGWSGPAHDLTVPEASQLFATDPFRSRYRKVSIPGSVKFIEST